MEQITIFDTMYPTFKITNKIRLIELFGGVGSQAMALRDLGTDFEHHRLVEFDKYAVASYNAIHNTDFPTSDIREVGGADLGIRDTDLYTYILTYSFPCQDLSLAGKQKGMAKDSGTRSGLLWEVERLLNEVEELPQVLLMENVPQVISQANIADFHKWQDFLTSKGYTNYVDVLNAKDFGVAQNRNRCFMVSILGEYNYKFPQPMPLAKTVNDYLEDEVDEKYYINSEKAQSLIKDLEERGELRKDTLIGGLQANQSIKQDGVCTTLTSSMGTGGGYTPMVVDGTINNPKRKDIANCIIARYDCGIQNQPTMGTMVVEQRADEGLRTFKDGLCGTIRSEKESGGDKRVIVASRGRNKDNPSDRTVGSEVEQRLEVKTDGTANTLTTVAKANMVLESAAGGIYQNGRGYNDGGLKELAPTLTSHSWQENNFAVAEKTQYRLRKLTPLECWRLMDFTDEDFCAAMVGHRKVATEIIKKYGLHSKRFKTEAEAIQKMSNSQLYKQAGNSIVKAVLMAIFNQIIER